RVVRFRVLICPAVNARAGRRGRRPLQGLSGNAQRLRRAARAPPLDPARFYVKKRGKKLLSPAVREGGGGRAAGDFACSQYATPQTTIFFAARPQTGQVSPSCSCSKGMQRLETPASSFIFSSQASSPHH